MPENTETISREDEGIQFINAAADTKGHSARMFFRSPPSYDVQVEQIVESKFFPYKSKSELLRHALLRHIKWLVAQAPVPSLITEIELANEVYREERIRQEVDTSITRTQDVVSVHMARNNPEMAQRFVARAMAHINNAPDGFWKRYYLSEAKKRFGYVETVVNAMKLAPSAFVDDED